MSTVPIRLAMPEDAGVLGQLLFDFNTEFEAPTDEAAELASRFEGLLGRGDDFFALISGAADPSGFALVTLRHTPYFDGPLAQLEEMYVVPHLRNQGIGTALMATTLETVGELNAGELHIDVDEVDTDGRRFYERNGFTNVEPGTDSRVLCYLRPV